MKKGRRRMLVSVVMAILFMIPMTGDSDDRGFTIEGTEGIPRLGLVIGNSAYKTSPLTNPVNDARDLTRILRSLGFEVIHKEDSGQREMEEAIREFGSRLKKGGEGIFYFSGHGIQVNGQNYLIPIDADLFKETDVKYEAVNAGRVLDEMYNAENRLNIVILDACRDNPFIRSFRGFRPSGLAQMHAPQGTLIAYATSPGSVADDGDGDNGVYTKYLMKYMMTPGLKIEDVLKNVRIEVVRETRGRQTPWEHSSLMGDFCFRPGKKEKNAYLSVESNVRDAKVIVDGDHAGQTPLPETPVPTGKRWVIIKKEGYEPYKHQIDFRPGKSVILPVSLKPAEVTGNGRLFVNTEPENASVKFLSIRKEFRQGIRLEPGAYHIEVSAKGYESRKEWTDLSEGKNKTLEIRLKPATQTGPRQGRLFVRTEPVNAAVKFLNISSLYRPGMKLDPGPYDLEISANGYESLTKRVRVSPGEDLRLTLRLNLKPAPEKPDTSAGASEGPPYKLAIFPWQLKNDAAAHLRKTESVIRQAISAKKELFILKYEISGENTEREITDANALKKIWKKKHFFANPEPDADIVCKIGKQLGVDAVLMGDLSVVGTGSVHHRIDTIQLFLVDIRSKKVFSIRNSSDISIYMGDFNNSVDSLVRNILNRYKS